MKTDVAGQFKIVSVNTSYRWFSIITISKQARYTLPNAPSPPITDVVLNMLPEISSDQLAAFIETCPCWERIRQDVSAAVHHYGLRALWFASRDEKLEYLKSHIFMIGSAICWCGPNGTTQPEPGKQMIMEGYLEPNDPRRGLISSTHDHQRDWKPYYIEAKAF